METPIIKKYGGHDNQLSRKLKAMDLWRVKAMLNIRNSFTELLNEKEINSLNLEISKKSEILKLGYQKRNLTKELEYLYLIIN